MAKDGKGVAKNLGPAVGEDGKYIVFDTEGESCCCVSDPPDPESPPFVTVGCDVNEGETVLIIEAMKVMNPIPAHRSGKVKEILVQGSDPVEFGQPIMVIE